MMEHPLPSWAPVCLREARLGIAKRCVGGTEDHLQAFDWCAAMSKLLCEGVPRSRASELCDHEGVLWVLPRSRRSYWDLINKESACHWDGMEPCCVGVAYHNQLAVVVYDRMKVIAELQVTAIDSSIPVPESHWRIRAIEAFDFLANYDLGNQTPFYI